RLAAGCSREDGPGAAQLLEFRGRVLGLAVDVDCRAELAREGLLVFAASDADRVEAHLGGELNPEVTEPAEAEHGDDVAWPGAAIAQGVEGGNAGTHEWRCVGRR